MSCTICPEIKRRAAMVLALMCWPHASAWTLSRSENAIQPQEFAPTGGGAVQGKVLYGKRGIEGAEVFVCPLVGFVDEDQPWLKHRARTTKYGSFLIDAIEPGIYSIWAVHPGFAAMRSDPIIDIRSQETVTVGLRLYLSGSLRLRVRDPQDCIPARFSVSFHRGTRRCIQDSHCSWPHRRLRNGGGFLLIEKSLHNAAHYPREVLERDFSRYRDDLEFEGVGETIWTHLEPGMYYLSVTAPDFEQAIREVRVDSRKQASVDVQLQVGEQR